MTSQQEFNANPKIKALPEDIRTKLDSFIFEDIKKISFLKPDGNPKKEWKIFYGDTWDAAMQAAADAIRNTTWDTAKNAAQTAIWDAVWNASRNTATNTHINAIRNIIWNITRDIVQSAGWDAAFDAALYSYYILASDLEIKDKEKHLEHVKARWEVWQKGYGLLCDVDGVLYVYCMGAQKLPRPLTEKETREQLADFEKRVAELERTAIQNADKLDKIKAILS